MVDKSLLLTLGHNSSAVFIDGDFIIGYEQERFSGLKADSQFPQDCINEIIKNVTVEKMKDCNIFISHWFDFDNTNIPNKYITENDLSNLKSISNNIHYVTPDFTHHDAHAYSAKAFFNYHFNKRKEHSIVKNAIEKCPKINIIVADGFGNEGEVISLYEMNYSQADKNPKLIHRVYGYRNSIGLMYQYATSFVGMKENQDEYKFLGYEAHIDEYLNKNEIEKLNEYIKYQVSVLKEGFENCTGKDNYTKEDSIINFSELKNTKEYFNSFFASALNSVWSDEYENNYNDEEKEFIQRTIVAYVLQQTVEKFFSYVVDKFDMHNIIVTGGSFYNVKLNNSIYEKIDGLYCAMPLAGDQGAAFGMYDKYIDKQINFETLCIGKRNFYGAEKVFGKNFYKEATDELAFEIARKIADGYIVDVVHSSMEFGPRALMHTSSLFIPSTENTAQNNSNNLRNEVMPCAPVLTKKNADILFGENNIDRVIGSDEFMILTHNYLKPYSELYGGVMHKIVLKDGFTGRPQIVRHNTFEEKILDYVEELTDLKCIVNTSFNKHGTPILFSMKQIKDDYNFQKEHSKYNGYSKTPLLYVIE